MRVLLDENLPHQLRSILLGGIEAVTVSYLGWKGIENGELLRIAADELNEIREWHITNLLKLKEIFQPEIERALETLNSEQSDNPI